MNRGLSLFSLSLPLNNYTSCIVEIYGHYFENECYDLSCSILHNLLRGIHDNVYPKSKPLTSSLGPKIAIYSVTTDTVYHSPISQDNPLYTVHVIRTVDTWSRNRV
jgi:hypothetical protein